MSSHRSLARMLMAAAAVSVLIFASACDRGEPQPPPAATAAKAATPAATAPEPEPEPVEAQPTPPEPDVVHDGADGPNQGAMGVLSISQVSFERTNPSRVSIVDSNNATHAYTYTGANATALAETAFAFSRVEGATWEKPGGGANEFVQLEVVATNTGRSAAGPMLNSYNDGSRELTISSPFGSRIADAQASGRALAECLVATNGLPEAERTARVYLTEDQAGRTLTLTLKLD